MSGRSAVKIVRRSLHFVSLWQTRHYGTRRRVCAFGTMCSPSRRTKISHPKKPTASEWSLPSEYGRATALSLPLILTGSISTTTLSLTPCTPKQDGSSTRISTTWSDCERSMTRSVWHTDSLCSRHTARAKPNPSLLVSIARAVRARVGNSVCVLPSSTVWSIVQTVRNSSP